MNSSYSYIRKTFVWIAVTRCTSPMTLLPIKMIPLRKSYSLKKPGKNESMVYVDEGIIDGNPNLLERIKSYFRSRDDQLDLVCEPEFILGGEPAKTTGVWLKVWSNLNKYGMCRHSYVIIVGGGASLDLVGFAASTAHRGVRLIRFPTTTLSQETAELGLKRGQLFW